MRCKGATPNLAVCDIRTINVSYFSREEGYGRTMCINLRFGECGALFDEDRKLGMSALEERR